MPYSLEYFPALGSGMSKKQTKAIVTNSITGHHFSTDPIPIKKAKAQMRYLAGIEHGMVPNKK